MFTAESASETGGRGAAGVSPQREPTIQVNDALCCDLRTRSWFPTRSRLEALGWAVGQSARRRGFRMSNGLVEWRRRARSVCCPKPTLQLTNLNL